MRERGRVRETKGILAVVELPRTTACKQCGICFTCEDDENVVLTEAKNPLHARAGDEVNIEVEPKSVYKATAIIYILPIFFLILGYLVGRYAVGMLVAQYKEAAGVFVGFLVFGLSFFVIWWMDKKAKASGKYEPTVVEIIKRSS